MPPRPAARGGLDQSRGADAARALAALRRGTRVKFGVAVDGAVVREAPVRVTLTRPPVEDVETWYPGTRPTAAEIEEQQRAESAIVLPTSPVRR